MTDQIKSVSPVNEFNNWRSVVISLYMTLVGYGVLVGIPVINTAWVKLLGFTEVQVGPLTSADLGGLSVGAVLTALMIADVNRRKLVVIAAAIAIGANALCMYFVGYEQVLVLRFFAGLGSGIYTAVAVATLGATSRPAWAFNLMLFAFAFSQAGELYLLPKLSMNGIYGFFIGCYLLGLLFLHWLPTRPRNIAPAGIVATDVGSEHASDDPVPEHAGTTAKVPVYVPWLVLSAIVVTYINIGAYWAYIELAAANSEADPEWVGKLLVYTSIFSLVGCLVATLISDRFGLARPLLVTLVIHAAVVSMLIGGINNTNILFSLFAFNFLWIFIDVYQMSTIANVDPHGRFASLIPGAQGLGQLLGPLIAAALLATELGYDAVFLMCAIASLTAMCIYLYMYLRLRKAIPALADAS